MRVCEGKEGRHTPPHQHTREVEGLLNDKAVNEESEESVAHTCEEEDAYEEEDTCNRGKALSFNRQHACLIQATTYLLEVRMSVCLPACVHVSCFSCATLWLSSRARRQA